MNMVHQCENGQFFDENRQECDNPENFPPPCGNQDLGSIFSIIFITMILC